MRVEDIINELEPLGSTKTKKHYMSQGAKEPLYGLTIKSMKPLAKRLKKLENCQQIAYDLYNTGNYDLMYLAGMIVDPTLMSVSKFNEWLKQAYFYMISDYIVAICLSETDIAMEVADEWIKSDSDLIMSAGYSTYSWLLASREDELFDKDALNQMLGYVKSNIHNSPNRTKYAMYYFVYNIGVSYIPLHKEALDVAESIGEVMIYDANGKGRAYNAKDDIVKEVNRSRLGFKRRYVRC